MKIEIQKTYENRFEEQLDNLFDIAYMLIYI